MSAVWHCGARHNDELVTRQQRRSSETGAVGEVPASPRGESSDGGVSRRSRTHTRTTRSSLTVSTEVQNSTRTLQYRGRYCSLYGLYPGVFINAHARHRDCQFHPYSLHCEHIHSHAATQSPRSGAHRTTLRKHLCNPMCRVVAGGTHGKPQNAFCYRTEEIHRTLRREYLCGAHARTRIQPARYVPTRCYRPDDCGPGRPGELPVSVRISRLCGGLFLHTRLSSS